MMISSVWYMSGIIQDHDHVAEVKQKKVILNAIWYVQLQKLDIYLFIYLFIL